VSLQSFDITPPKSFLLIIITIGISIGLAVNAKRTNVINRSRYSVCSKTTSSYCCSAA